MARKTTAPAAPAVDTTVETQKVDVDNTKDRLTLAQCADLARDLQNVFALNGYTVASGTMNKVLAVLGGVKDKSSKPVQTATDAQVEELLKLVVEAGDAGLPFGRAQKIPGAFAALRDKGLCEYYWPDRTKGGTIAVIRLTAAGKEQTGKNIVVETGSKGGRARSRTRK